MPFVRESKCRKCGKLFLWEIERPGDGFWDRWKSDNGKTLANWFVENSLCWDHAMEEMPKEFRSILRTIAYEEKEPEKQPAQQ